MKVACLGLLVLMVSTACPADTSSVEFPVLGSITKIDVAGRDPNKILWEFTDVQAISRTVAFVDAHRTGWGKPWKDIQTPILRFEFYSGTAFKGTLSAGDDFFEMQRENDLLSQKADFAEISGFLDLLVPAGESAGILDGDFKLLSSVKQLPPQVKSAFAALAGQPVVMADPGQAVNYSDVIGPSSPPSRKMILAGVSGTKCFLHYGMGGFEVTYHLVVFDLNPNGTRVTWVGFLREPAENLTQLRLLVRFSRNVMGSTYQRVK